MADNDSDFGAFFTGFLFGGLVGAAAALLLAPQSGEETRAQIRQRSIELRDQAEDLAEDTRRRAEEVAVQTRARAEKLAAEARARAEEIQDRGRAAFNEQRDKLATRISRKPAGEDPDLPSPAAS